MHMLSFMLSCYHSAEMDRAMFTAVMLSRYHSADMDRAMFTAVIGRIKFQPQQHFILYPSYSYKLLNF